MINNPKVSVCITTYFHEKYIAQALDSVLKQAVSFEYEICVSDDASEDNTQAILLQYEKKYPNIRLNFNSENIGLTRNFDKVYSMARGKYVVVLSGDDYYIDDCKLQKQFDFLENDIEHHFSGVATSIETRFDNEVRPQRIYPNKKILKHQPFSLEMFMKGLNCPLNGIMTRNYWLSSDKNDMKLMVDASKFIDDITLSILYLQKGDIFILADICTAYRVQTKIKEKHNFNSINKGFSSFAKHVSNLNYLHEVFKDLDFFHRYKLVLKDGYAILFRTRGFKAFNTIYKEIPKEYRKRCLKFRTIISLIPRFFKKVFRH